MVDEFYPRADAEVVEVAERALGKAVRSSQDTLSQKLDHKVLNGVKERAL